MGSKFVRRLLACVFGRKWRKKVGDNKVYLYENKIAIWGLYEAICWLPRLDMYTLENPE